MTDTPPTLAAGPKISSESGANSTGVRVLFLGGVVPRHQDNPPIDLTQYGALDNAANAYQWNMINGLERQLGSSVQIISAPFISARRGIGRSRRVKGFEWGHDSSSEGISLSFVDVFGVRNVTREIAVRRAIRRILSETRGHEADHLVVFVYAMHGPFLQQLAQIKRLRPLAEICLIVPDLPQHMRDLDNAGRLMRFLKRVDMRRNQKCLSLVDKYILISVNQAGELCIEDRPYLVVEGMVETEQDDGLGSEHNISQSPAFRVVYTGQLNERYGLKDLVDSLDHVRKPDVELVICGDGQMSDYLADRAAVDPRVVWLGRVSREESLRWQASADVLVNPRQGAADYTKYSFPSKNLEYLYAGKPVIAYRTEGTPPEYDDHFIYISEPGPAAIAQAIEHVMAMSESERRTIGERAKRFVETEKSVDRQMGRVLAFIGGRE